MNIIIAGGAGYIGSILTTRLLEKNYNVLILDNLSNVPEKYDRLMHIRRSVSDNYKQHLTFNEIDIANDYDNLEKEIQLYVQEHGNIDWIVNLAADKSIEHGENNPAQMIQNNINITTNLLLLCNRLDISNYIFSSSAAVYNENIYDIPYNELNNGLSIDESNICLPKSVYGCTKLLEEKLVEQYAYRKPNFNYLIFRFFNVIGAHKYRNLGDTSTTNLVSNICKASIEHTPLQIFGINYDTEDGTCERDFIDVNDICTYIETAIKSDGVMYRQIINLGTGESLSVLQIVNTFNKIVPVDNKVQTEYTSSRDGDAAVSLCDNSIMKEVFNIEPKMTLEQSLEDAYNFYKNYKGV